MFKKAMSPIVAVTLLLALTVSSYFLLQGWMGEFSQDFQTEYYSQNSNGMSRTEIKGLNGEELYFKNTFNSNLTILDIKVGNKSCGITGELDKGINNINLSNCYSNISKGVNEFVVFTDKGVFSKTYHLGTSILGQEIVSECLNSVICFIEPTPVNNLVTLNRDHLINVSINLEDIENVSFTWNGVEEEYYKVSTDQNFSQEIDYADLNLVLALDFDTNSDLSDKSEYNNPIVITGPVWTNNGKYQGGFSFDGTNDYIDTGMSDLGNKFSFSAWVKTDVANDRQILFENYKNTARDVFFELRDDGQIYLYVDNLGSVLASSYNADEWMHLVGIIDSDNGVTLYKNGQLLGTSKTGTYTAFDTGVNYWIGTRLTDYPFHPFNGVMDEIRIYNKALTQEDVDKLYNSSLNKFSENIWNFEIEKNNLNVGTSVYSAEVCDISSCYQTETRSITTNREDYVTNSVLFDGTDDYLSWTPAQEGNRTTWTYSTWIKRAYSSDTDFLFSARIDGWNTMDFYIANDNKLYWQDYDQGVAEPGWNIYPSIFLRDYSTWMNVLLVVDTNNPVNSERTKIYIDGKRIEDFTTETYPNLGYITQIGVNSLNTHYIGATSTGNYFNGYMSEVNFIDGQALEASNFGEFNGYGKWVPKQYQGTYGSNGFYLNFSNNLEELINQDTTFTGWNDGSSNGQFSVTTYDSRDVMLLDSTTASGSSYGRAYYSPTVFIDKTVFEFTAYHDNSFGALSTNDFIVQFHQKDSSAGYIQLHFDEQYIRFLNNTNYYTLATFVPPTGQWVDYKIEIDYSTMKINLWVDDVKIVEDSPISLWTLSGSWGDSRVQISQMSSDTTQRRTWIDSVKVSTSEGLGKDSSGNENDWISNGGPTQTIDTPENNFATLNPLDWHRNNGAVTLSEGNLKYESTDAGRKATLAVPNSGKWYWEVVLDDVRANGPYFGVTNEDNTQNWGTCYAPGPIFYTDGNSIPSSGTVYSDGDVASILVDMDNRNLTFYRNNVYNWHVEIPESDIVLPSTYFNGIAKFNFGATPFQYSIPEGYKTLSSKNLEVPSVIPSKGFDVLTYTGTGAARNIEGLDFLPSLVWIKNRDQTDDHKLFDIVRGPTKYIESNTNLNAEMNDANSLTSFNSNGFSLGSGLNGFNDNNEEFVAWNWKEGPEFGFDIVNYTGNGGVQIINHNLNKKPDMIFTKQLSPNAVSLKVYHSSLGATKSLFLDVTDAEALSSIYWNDIEPTEDNFTLGSGPYGNDLNGNYIAYLFTSIEGFSKIGSYTGNGNVDGPFIYTGFKPKYVMVKKTNDLQSWGMSTDTDVQGNAIPDWVWADSNQIEDRNWQMDFLANGFKIRAIDAWSNTNGDNYIYIAFADYPLSTNY